MRTCKLQKYWLLFAIAGFVLLCDQVTKWYIDSTMRPHETIVVIENFFNITYVRNPGAAFGFLSTSNQDIVRPFFLIISFAAIAGILYFYRTISSQQYLSQVGFALILGGALGNLIDRWRLHEVIDFLDVHWYNTYHWPAFNVADSCITVGVGLLILDIVRAGPGTKS